jgi:hypothetical protein
MELPSARSTDKLTSSLTDHCCLSISSTSDLLALANSSASFIAIPLIGVGTSSRVRAERLDLEGGNGRSYLSALGVEFSILLLIFPRRACPQKRELGSKGFRMGRMKVAIPRCQGSITSTFRFGAGVCLTHPLTIWGLHPSQLLRIP